MDPARRSFFSEIVSSVSDIKFSHSGRYLLTRDYLTVKVWDLNMESKPVETYQVSHLLTHTFTDLQSHGLFTFLMLSVPDQCVSNKKYQEYHGNVTFLRYCCSTLLLYFGQLKENRCKSINSKGWRQPQEYISFYKHLDVWLDKIDVWLDFHPQTLNIHIKQNPISFSFCTSFCAFIFIYFVFFSVLIFQFISMPTFILFLGQHFV